MAPPDFSVLFSDTHAALEAFWVLVLGENLATVYLKLTLL